MIRALPFPSVLFDSAGRIIDLNAEATALFGSDLLFASYVLRFRRPQIAEAIALALQGKASEPLLIASDDDGSVMLYHIRPMKAEGGALLICQDVTATEKAARQRREFVANVSHELRTPLTSLMGFIETLQGPAAGDAAARAKFLAIMAGEAARMNRLVSDLLTLSAVEADERVRPLNAIDLATLVRQVIERLEPQAAQSGSELVLGAAPELMVAGDSDQIGQALSNLIENALRYGKPGGRVRVAITTAERDAKLLVPVAQISVADEGPGIEPHHLPRLTERFYRVDAHRSRAAGGTGLGLAIVKHILSRHRGRLAVTSQLGQGSVFTICLPLS